MNPTQISELKAFIFSLSQLDAPLPENVQIKIKQIDIPSEIHKLHDIASNYPPLANMYKQVLGILDDKAEYRSKGMSAIPQYQPDKRNLDVNNDLVKIEKKLIEFEEKVDDNNLITICSQITQALNSVETAKFIIENSLLNLGS